MKNKKDKKSGRAADAACVIKKYPNRRLYDTCASAYITLVDIKQRVIACEPFEVRDARTGEDITRSILLQIILEEESGARPLLSTDSLTRIIRFHGHAMQEVMAPYLDNSIRLLQALQERTASRDAALTAALWMNPPTPLLEGFVGSFSAPHEPVSKTG